MFCHIVIIEVTDGCLKYTPLVKLVVASHILHMHLSRAGDNMGLYLYSLHHEQDMMHHGAKQIALTDTIIMTATGNWLEAWYV